MGSTSSLLTYDAVNFNRYLDTVLAASSPPPGSTRQTQSPWLFLDAAHTIFDSARRRVYTGKANDNDLLDNSKDLPGTLQSVLEEQPKWAVLADILEEIERDVYFNPVISDDSNGSTLIMAGDHGTCRQIREYLQTMHTGPTETNANEETDRKPSAAYMMRRKLRNYFAWKRDFAKVSASLFSENQKTISGTADQRGAQNARGRGGPANKRRRMRGGSSGASTRTTGGHVTMAGDRDAHIASLMAELQPTEQEEMQKAEIATDPLDDMETFYELYDMKELLLIHPYDGDMDERLLEEIKPRYIVMYEPDAAFIRRIEVYRSSHTDRNIKVYFLYYGGSVEEQRYLSAVRREKDAFTKLIKERGVSASGLVELNVVNVPSVNGGHPHAGCSRHRGSTRKLSAHHQHPHRRWGPSRCYCSPTSSRG